MFGYKLATLRGVLDNAGIIEEIALGGIKESDLKLGKFVIESNYLQEGDILIEDRGFLGGETISRLKLEKGVDVFIPAKKNMTMYKEAVKIANSENNWVPHPTRNNQEISLVIDIECLWDALKPGVKIHSAVAREKDAKTDEYEYFVFLTTQEVKYAKTIINVYETRPEIEEDFRHLKPVWGLRDFNSTKYVNVIFHIVTTLLAFNMFKIFTNTKSGEKIGNKTLKRIMLERRRFKESRVIVYAGSFLHFYIQKTLYWHYLEYQKLKGQSLRKR